MIAVKSAAYHDRRWAISRIPQGDVVFLYHTGVGVIAKGKATSGYKIADFNRNEGEEFHVPLEFYWSLEEDQWGQAPTAADINQELECGPYTFRRTVFAIGKEMARTIDDIANEKGVFQPVIPAFAGITSFRGAGARQRAQRSS